jgi:nucleoside-diphosphate-sugar epimerase
MRVFVTGASGYIGSALVQDLLAAGHEVVGLARSDESAAEIEAAGATALRGDITDHDSLQRGARDADAVAHLAFNHDFSKFAQNGADDAAAIRAMGDVLAGSGKPLVTTSGTGMLSNGKLATEDTVREPNPNMPRQTEPATDEQVARGVKAMSIRLPQVHGPGDHAFTPMLINIAREKGYAAYIGDGANRWPAVHRLDAAKLYLLALEKGQAGRNYHAVAEEGVRMRDIAETIGRGLGVPVKSITAEEAGDYFGWFAMFAGMDNPASSAITRKELGWNPVGPTLIHDMENEDYFVAK